MNLVRLIYASRFGDKMTMQDLQAIVDVSRATNPMKSITGMLCYGPGLFLQCIEGPRAAVNDLYLRIANDRRNKDVTLLAYDDVDERLFEEWSMAYVRSDDLTRNLVLKYSSGSHFDPFFMTAKQALGFVRSLLDEKKKFLRQTGRTKGFRAEA